MNIKNNLPVFLLNYSQSRFVLGIALIMSMIFFACIGEAQAEVGFFLYNAPNRSVVQFVSPVGVVNNTYGYNSFGNVKDQVEHRANTIKYVGERLEKESELIYLRNRYYDTRTGRFISKDFFPGSTEKPLTINPYIYCSNNPVNYTDPQGLLFANPAPPSVIDATFVIVGGSAGVVGQGVQDLLSKKFSGWEAYLGSAIGGMAGGEMLYRTGDQVLAGATSGAIGNAATQAMQLAWNDHPSQKEGGAGQFDVGKLLLSTGSGAFFGKIGEKISVPGFAAYQGGMGRVVMNFENSGQSNFLTSATQVADYRIGSAYNSIFLSKILPDALNKIDGFINSFGGVSLNKTANLMLNIQDIGGAKFDPATGQVILYGKKNVGLPQMKLDDLSVAVSSVYGLRKTAQDPGVSIGTEASDVPGQMKVRYDGDTANTAFGVTMFDSDRLLKTLSMGKDNITGASVSSSVSGYQNMLDRYRAGGTAGYLAAAANPTNRMWFTPQEVKLVESADGDAMLFDSVKMQLLTESTKNGVVGSDPFAEAFASHFTANYDAFATERPVLQELKRLGKMTAVVKWIKDNDIPFDLSFFKSYTPEVHATPAYTPQTSVSTSWRDGMMFYTMTITGGVVYRLDDTNFTSTTGSTAAAAGDAAVNSRPSEGSFSWDFSANGQTYTAIAQSFTRSQKDGSVRGSTTDMAFPVTGDVPLAFVRYYDSFYDSSTGFGYGWQVTPFAVRFPDDVRSFTFNSSQISVNAHYQLYLRAGQGEFLYTLSGLDANNKAIYLREGGSDILKDMGDGTYVLDMRNKGKVAFDSTGRVTRITDKNDIAITYNYSANGLSSIVHQGGRTITLNYTSGKITSVTGSGVLPMPMMLPVNLLMGMI